MVDGIVNGIAKPVIFISYSHKDEPKDGPNDEKWLSYVQYHLAPAVKSALFDLWVDEDIPGGDKWKATIAAKLKACDVCVLLVSPNSLASDYVIDVEVKTIKERQKNEDVPLFPIRLKPFAESTVPWLMVFNLRPPNGKSLWELEPKPREKAMVAIVNEIVDIVNKIAERKLAAVVARPEILGRLDVKLDGVKLEARGSTEPARFVGIDTVHLPETPYERLVGRDEELKRLDEAWASPSINIFSLVAEGGAGKSALVNEWLARMQAENFRGAGAVLGWSFYSQGSKERATSADAFLHWALNRLGIKLETTSASAKGEAIAEALAKRRVLLLLDGAEPLQHGPGTQTGQLKDLGLRALLRRFVLTPTGEPHGLIMLTSRLAVADIARWKNTAAPVLDVEQLSDEAGAALLRDNGVWGTDKELQAAAHDFAGHPLALGLLASFLKETQFGDARQRDHIRTFFADADNPRHDHAKRVMESYEKEWLADQPVLLGIMHIVGLFDRPATGDCLWALREKPAIEGLTDAIVNLTEDEWNRAVVRLCEVRLLSPLDKSAPEALDAHPLVREWFGESFRKKNELAWRAAHSRLYEHLRDRTKEGGRPTLENLEPLYQAIAHGCRANRHQEALDDVYDKRICRRQPDGKLEYYASKKLGAFGNNLAAITWFFDKPFGVPVAALDEADRSWVLNEAGYSLRAQGRFAEALPAFKAALRMREVANDWGAAATSASNLSAAELTLGDVASAVLTAEKAVSYADCTGNASVMMVNRATQADALHAAGQREQAEKLFADAERRQLDLQPSYPLLYSLQGYRYCDLLLSCGKWVAARDRAARILGWEDDANPMLDRSLVRLSLSRAHLGLALVVDDHSAPPAERQRDAETVRACLIEAVDGLRAAGHLDHISRGLLAHAAFRRSIGDWRGAARCLDEVEEVAGPGPMKLFLCDMAIERARLAFARIEAFAPLNGILEHDNPPKPLPLGAEEVARLKSEAAEQLNTAANYIATCSYQKRDEERAELQAVLRGEKTFASLPPRV